MGTPPSLTRTADELLSINFWYNLTILTSAQPQYRVAISGEKSSRGSRHFPRGLGFIGSIGLNDVTLGNLERHSWELLIKRAWARPIGVANSLVCSK